MRNAGLVGVFDFFSLIDMLDHGIGIGYDQAQHCRKRQKCGGPFQVRVGMERLTRGGNDMSCNWIITSLFFFFEF